MTFARCLLENNQVCSCVDGDARWELRWKAQLLIYWPICPQLWTQAVKRSERMSSWEAWMCFSLSLITTDSDGDQEAKKNFILKYCRSCFSFPPTEVCFMVFLEFNEKLCLIIPLLFSGPQCPPPLISMLCTSEGWLPLSSNGMFFLGHLQLHIEERVKWAAVEHLRILDGNDLEWKHPRGKDHLAQ